jgi:hypothetical protein
MRRKPSSPEPGDAGAPPPESLPEPAHGGRAVPSPDTVVSETTFTSPKGRVYRIVRTAQTDEYDLPAGTADAGAAEAGRDPEDEQA